MDPEINEIDNNNDSEAIYNSYNYASPGQRFFNWLIDLLIFMVVTFIVSFILGMVLMATRPEAINLLTGEDITSKLTQYFISYVVYIFTYTIIEGASSGSTLGKLITGTKAIKEDGSSINWKDALVRSLIRIVPFEPFSALSGNPWHDKWSKTTVVKTR